MSQYSQHDTTIFPVPVRWVIRALAWIAFFIASYLAWKAATGEAVPGCGVGSDVGCDLVLSSSWSKWLAIPVSVAGLACYATLAGLSVLIGLTGPRESRWIDTLIVLLSTLAGAASIWFLALQIVAIGHFCPYCIAVDSIGITLGGLALWSALRSPPSVAATQKFAGGVAAVRPMIPGAIPVVPLRTAAISSRPSLALAFGGAAAFFFVLVGGQLLFPAATHRTATVTLDKPMNLSGANPDGSETVSDVTPAAQQHMAMRINTDDEPTAETTGSDADGNPTASNNSAPVTSDGDAGGENDSASESNPSPSNGSPKRSRLVKFLGGQLTLDTYQHPILGDPEAPHVMVELISYDCPHCRKMHPNMQRALRRYGGQVAVIVMPIPFEMKCNKLIKDPKVSHPGACTTARMALAVARLKPAAFRAFHDAMMEDEKNPPSQAKSVAKAYGMVDSSKLPTLTRGEELNKQIAEYVDLFGTLQQQHAANKNFGLPIQILGDEVMSGSVEKADDVFKAWEKNLGLKPL